MKTRSTHRPTRLALAGLLLAAALAPARAQNFTLEGAVIDSRSAASLGVISERGDVAQLFKAQKAMTFGILRAAGIALDQLPAEVRQRLERFQTTNLDAFRAFSTGLDLKDQGRYAEAKDFFRRAADLDPGFGLAADQQRAMPDVTVSGQAQARAVVIAAAGQAVDRGRQTTTVDLAHALAAIQAGQAVYAAPAGADVSAQSSSRDTDVIGNGVNATGTGQNVQPNAVAGVSYIVTPAPSVAIGVAVSGEWTPEKLLVRNGALEALGAIPTTAGGSSSGFLAQVGGAANSIDGSTTLADGSTVSWGTWASAPGASAKVRQDNGSAVQAPELGAVNWMLGTAPRQMPTSGTAVFTPFAAGAVQGATGTMTVDFERRLVQLRNLGFSLGGLSFSGLNGDTLNPYAASARSGAFSGQFSSGQCSGCTGFSATGSSFNGNFVGKNADGAILSTVMSTGGGTASGVQLFKR